MGSINPGNLGPVNLASSVAGAQKNQQTDKAKEAASEKTFKQDLKTIAAQASGDVADPNFEKDRDADGRLPFKDEQHPEENVLEDADTKPEKADKAPDALDERGNKLDLEA
jgi:hypothetical protein